MGLQSLLARKFLAGKSRHWLSSSLTLMALGGVMFSVMAFVIVQAVMSGFNEDLENKILGFTSHLTVTLKNENGQTPDWLAGLARQKGVTHLQHYLEGEAILGSPEGEKAGVRVRGLDPEYPPEAETLKVNFEEGENWETFYGASKKLPGILMGAELAVSLGIVPVLAENVELLFPLGEVGPTGEVEPNVRTFRVVGTFRSGYYEYDSKYVMIPGKEAQWLFGDQAEDLVGVDLTKLSAAQDFKEALKSKPHVERVSTWEEQHRRLFNALKLERMGMVFVLTLMLLLSSFNILSFLMMVVYERRKEIAVLRALGMPAGKIVGIFHHAGTWIGLSGGLLGVGAGLGICLWLNQAHLPLPSSYYLEALPVKLHWINLLAAVAVAFGLSLLATLFPGRESKGLSITESLHYE